MTQDLPLPRRAPVDGNVPAARLPARVRGPPAPDGHNYRPRPAGLRRPRPGEEPLLIARVQPPRQNAPPRDGDAKDTGGGPNLRQQ